MTESRKSVLKETAFLAAGVLICAALMCGVYALIGKWSISVLLGALVGFLVATGNFFSLALIATLASDKAEAGDPLAGQKMIKGSYPIRLLVMAVVLILCAKSGYFDILALVLPLAFVRPVLMVGEFFRKKGA